MSYVYRERHRDRDWHEPRSSVSIKRYYVPREESPDRDFFYRRDDPALRNRELVIRHSSEDESVVPRRYERDYRSDRDYGDPYEREYPVAPGFRRTRSPVLINRPEEPVVVRGNQSVIVHKARGPVHIYPREPDYDFVRRSEVDPRDDERLHRHHLRDYELAPRDSVSQVSSRPYDDGYTSDDSMVYVRKEYHGPEEEPPKRHLMSGALVGIGAAELLRSRRKQEGDEVSHGFGRAGRDIGAGALGAVAANALHRYRSKSRRRSHSFDDDRSSYYYPHRHRSRGRSLSQSRASTMTELGLGAAAMVGAMAMSRNKSRGRGRSRSRHHRPSYHHSRHYHTPSSDDDSDDRGRRHRRKRTAEAGLAGAAVGGLVDSARGRSRSRHRHRSRSRGALPILAGAGSAAAASLYEKNKAKKLRDEERYERRRSASRYRRRSLSRHRSSSETDSESPTGDTRDMIEYGDQPVSAADYVEEPPRRHAYPKTPVPLSPNYRPSRPRSHSLSQSRSRSRSRTRGLSPDGYDDYPSYSESDDYDRPSRHYNRPRYQRQEDYYPYRNRNRDPYEEPYEPVPAQTPYAQQPASAIPPPQPPPPPPAPAPAPAQQYYPQPQPNYYQPPPPANPPPYASPTYAAGYPPPPVAAPQPQPYYGPPRPPPGTDPYGRARTADNMVSPVQTNALSLPDRAPAQDGLNEPPRKSGEQAQREGGQGSKSPSQPSQPKSVAFDLVPETVPVDPGYESDGSESTSDNEHQHHDETTPHSSPSSPDHRRSSEHHESGNDDDSGSDSDSSVIDLPNRFDSKGRLLPEREDAQDPLGGHLEDILRGISHVLL